MEGNWKIRLRAIVCTDVEYHPNKFQLNRIKTVGCESISKFQDARRHSAPLGGNRKIRDWATMRINVLCHYAKFQLSRPRNKEIEIEYFKRRAPQRFLSGSRKIKHWEAVRTIV